LIVLGSCNKEREENTWRDGLFLLQETKRFKIGFSGFFRSEKQKAGPKTGFL